MIHMGRPKKIVKSQISESKQPSTSLTGADAFERAYKMAETGKKGKGKQELLTYLKTRKPQTRTQAINAHCYECMGYCADGAEDCGSEACALYPFHPYSHKKKYTRTITPEHNAALQSGRASRQIKDAAVKK